jgi:hypothetical protein
VYSTRTTTSGPDEDPLEDGLVEQTPHRLLGRLVGAVQLVRPGHGPGDHVLHPIKCGHELAQPFLGLG